jgi:hypothetical protein
VHLAIDDIPGWLDDDAYVQRWEEALGGEVDRHWSEAHERRLRLLVARVAAQLPEGDSPEPSAVLSDASALFWQERV